MKSFHHSNRTTTLLTALGAFAAAIHQDYALATIVLTNSAPSYTQNFNSLASSGTSSSIPTDWAFSETGSNANATYTAGTGSSVSGDTFSFGTTAADRALGTLLSGSLVSTIGAVFENAGSTAITSLSLSYTGELWRVGTTGRTDRLDFQFSPTDTSITGTGFTDRDSLDFSTPSAVTPTGIGLKDGNIANNRTTISGTITGLSIAPGQVFAIRWRDFNATDADDGMAIDDFSITGTFTAIPEPTAALFGGLVTAALGLTVARRPAQAA